ncbi:MAG TPA: hypothetical protein VFQ61_17410, partial [Polyangiaceae bacterium]|nr:hypothetical protein [Polyangiaceae bacterium]
REAQGGGSGIDVAASTYGGILLVRRQSDSLHCEPVRLPAGLRIHVLSEPRPASTQNFVARVRALANDRPAEHRACLQRQAEASERAARALLDGDADALLAALAAQGEALLALGLAANIPIFTEALAHLRPEAIRAGAALLPSGAGGGDLALWVTRERAGESPTTLPPETPELPRLMLHLGAPGVARVPD